MLKVIDVLAQYCSNAKVSFAIDKKNKHLY